MKKLLLLSIFSLICALSWAQEYTITSAGQGNGGKYLVQITVNTDKKPSGSAEDLVMHYAVHGVLFRGVMSTDGYDEQKAIIKDPNVEDTKSDFFDAFWREKQYKKFATIVPSSLSVLKNKQIKKYETSAMLTIDKEALQQYMETSGVIKGFSNLW
jgi:hypothetical protein